MSNEEKKGKVRKMQNAENLKYCDRKYWDERFEEESKYEWFGGFDSFKHLIIPCLHPQSRILILGCGNSNLGFDLYDAGFPLITSLDYSSVVIERMESQSKGRKEMTWICEDLRDFKFNAASFDVILEKGTIDALLVDEKSPWTMSESGSEMMEKILTNISNILNDGGYFFSITFAQPHFRIPLYAKLKFNWSVNVDSYGRDFHYFVYKMSKGEKLESEILKRYTFAISEAPSAVIETDDADFLFKINV